MKKKLNEYYKRLNQKLYRRVKHVFGKKCPDVDDDCWTCRAWHFYDELKYGGKKDE